MTTEVKIHKQMTIADILAMFPDRAQRLAQEITNAGLHCVGCHAASYETLEAGMLGHGKPMTAVDQLVARLNSLLEEKISRDTITISPEAAEQFRAFASQDNKEGWGMRLGEEMAGCSGFEYVLDFSEKALPDDQVFTSHGVEIHVNKRQLPRLLGCHISYSSGIRDSGFKIDNPNVRSACGCGSSHGYDS